MSYVSELFRYPIKSCHPHKVSSIAVDEYGLKYDRRWALFNNNNICLTGRDYPKLLDTVVQFDEDSAIIFYRGERIMNFSIHTTSKPTPELQIHSYQAYGHYVNNAVDQWFSKLLQTTCRFVEVDRSRKRPVLEKHGGDDSNDVVGFSDQAPILILSESSLDDLNSRLKEKVPMNRFRPNIVVSDCDAYEEDSWEEIRINGLTFKIIQQCERCVFTTIDISSKEKHPFSEPLRTLSTYRQGPRGGVVLGVHAVPLGKGTISEQDSIKILS